MSACLSSASLQPVPDGYRFVATDRPGDAPVRGTVVFAPPFFEEMNKSRRMVALTSRALAADGWRVVRFDLRGCGDSSGDIAEASWSDWLDDLRREVEAADRQGGELWLWGLRAGALLLSPLLPEFARAHLMLWQPALSGSAVLSQFLRLRTVAAVTGGADAIDRKSLQKSLARGETIEVAGYPVNARLTAGLEAARFEIPAAHRGRMVWCEVGAAPAGGLSLPAARAVEQCRQSGIDVRTELVEGLQFWQTTEISELAQLVECTRLAMQPGAPVAAQAQEHAA